MPHIFEVTELTGAVKDVLESQFPFIWVRGQVSGVTRPPSGHLYFTLKDDRAQLSVVWFRNSRREIEAGGVDPATGEVLEHGFVPDVDDGMQVLVAGRLNVYEPRGTYQLVAEFVQEEGVGQLYLQFEAMKAKLQAKGYFAEDRKMRLPTAPKRVAVITAPTGAAIQDFLRIADGRGAGCEIRIHPSLVQGDRAPAQIAAALDDVCEQGWADVAVLIRGGGSIEDLWAFNTEPVADAIHRATLPVLSGVGHEVDVTIADYVADARAATPSHAAQMLWPERRELMQRLDGLELALLRAGQGLVSGRERALRAEERALAWLSPVRQVDRWRERFDVAARDLTRAWNAFYEGRATALDEAGRGLLAAYGPQTMEREVAGLDGLAGRLAMAMEGRLRGIDRDLAVASATLMALDPEKPLERGYGLVRSARTGRYLRSVDEVAPGDALEIRVRDGHLGADVTRINKDD
ncbi:exodeoxyribonuclease VII large subunit [Desulfovibrio ferrophilus]|uniref:Exodeoxyribonuclease 7 large subunit n=1 Tax=Desulfovibrio ferrophilus TaxID=241368 RepID=A0A2Z6AVM9_9BACT|nr:exodeoxyribonuclease VII large subunit [Desulfovibrio ferrophilus]BBD07273.1 exodeoxyribonuclease 7 large subunit [Desulfovibrio ferrophilus]